METRQIITLKEKNINNSIQYAIAIILPALFYLTDFVIIPQINVMGKETAYTVLFLSLIVFSVLSAMMLNQCWWRMTLSALLYSLLILVYDGKGLYYIGLYPDGTYNKTLAIGMVVALFVCLVLIQFISKGIIKSLKTFYDYLSSFFKDIAKELNIRKGKR